MNKKYNIVLLVILAASLMMSPASASNREDHAAGIGQMAHPTSSNGMEVCRGCHGDLGSATASGFCTKCHSFPVFASTATPTVTITATVTATLTATPQLTPNETKEIPDEVETKEETETQEEIETTTETEPSTVTTVSKTQTTPGFGIVAAIVGLFALALLVKRNNR